ncbi:hmu [Symbiodinium sp. CCMP2592]|nr:hmu [Symbiodinium sp. CCMP2592]
MQEISDNFVWLKPVCIDYPRRVPSAFLLTDAMLVLDQMLNGGLILPADGDTRSEAAAREGKRIKKLMGDNSTDERVSILKSYLQASPRKKQEEILTSHLQQAAASSDDSDSSDAAESSAEEDAESDPVRITTSPVSPCSTSEIGDRARAARAAAMEDANSQDGGDSDASPAPLEDDERRDDSDSSPAPMEDDECGDDSDASPAPLKDDESGCLRRGKSTVDLGALCGEVASQADSSESEAAEAAENVQALSPPAAESEEEEIADHDSHYNPESEDDGSVDSQVTLRLGEWKLPDAACSVKEKAEASAELQKALVEAGRCAGPSRARREVADGMKTLATPPCKSKGMHAVDMLTPSPVPMQTSKKMKSKSLASFKRRHVLKKSKAKRKEIEKTDKAHGLYGDYNLQELQIPKAAWPQRDRTNKGKHSFTLKSAVGPATIEVLVRTGAFFLKRINENASGPLGQINFKRFGSVAEAWAVAKQRSGYVEP